MGKLSKEEIEESERELVLDPKPINDYTAHTLVVGKKVYKVTNKRDEVSFALKKTEFNGSRLEFEYRKNVKETARCSLGHNHDTGKVSTHYGDLSISWDEVDKMIEWIQLGSYREMQGKDSKAVDVIRQCLSFLETIHKELSEPNQLMASKLKNKIRDCRFEFRK